jgi:hypothetical protein
MFIAELPCYLSPIILFKLYKPEPRASGILTSSETLFPTNGKPAAKVTWPRLLGLFFRFYLIELTHEQTEP